MIPRNAGPQGWTEAGKNDLNKKAGHRPAFLLIDVVSDQASMTATISSVRGLTTTISSPTRKYS